MTTTNKIYHYVKVKCRQYKLIIDYAIFLNHPWQPILCSSTLPHSCQHRCNNNTPKNVEGDASRISDELVHSICFPITKSTIVPVYCCKVVEIAIQYTTDTEMTM